MLGPWTDLRRPRAEVWRNPNRIPRCIDKVPRVTYGHFIVSAIVARMPSRSQACARPGSLFGLRLLRDCRLRQSRTLPVRQQCRTVRLQ